jgi:hypothetical protein
MPADPAEVGAKVCHGAWCATWVAHHAPIPKLNQSGRLRNRLPWCATRQGSGATPPAGAIRAIRYYWMNTNSLVLMSAQRMFS